MSAPQKHRRARPLQEGRKAPYIMVGHWVAFHADLAPQAKAVYLVMLAYATGADMSDGGSSEVWPARESIAEALGWNRPQSCDQWIEQLSKAGAIEVLPPEKGDADRNNHYIVHGTPPESFAGCRSQSEFSAARRARRGHRKGETKPQVSDDADCRITQMGDDAVERTTDDAVDRTYLMRQGAHEQEPPTRTTELEENTRAAREAAAPLCVDPPLEIDFSRNPDVEPDPVERQIARVERKRARTARSAKALDASAHSASSIGIVEAFLKTFKVRPVPKVIAQWCASVTELQKTDHPELLIKRAMVACRDAGYPPSALASFASGLVGQADSKKSRGTAKFEAEMQDGMDRYGIDPLEAFKLMYPNADHGQSPELTEEAS